MILIVDFACDKSYIKYIKLTVRVRVIQLT